MIIWSALVCIIWCNDMQITGIPQQNMQWGRRVMFLDINIELVSEQPYVDLLQKCYSTWTPLVTEMSFCCQQKCCSACKRVNITGFCFVFFFFVLGNTWNFHKLFTMRVKKKTVDAIQSFKYKIFMIWNQVKKNFFKKCNFYFQYSAILNIFLPQVFFFVLCCHTLRLFLFTVCFFFFLVSTKKIFVQ